MQEAPVRTIPEMCADSRLLIEVLRNVPLGEVVTYEKLSAAIDMNVRQQKGYGRLQTALKTVRRDYGMDFGTVRGVGLRHNTSSETVRSAQADIDHTRRRMKRGLAKLSCVNPSTLSSDELVDFNVKVAWMGAVHHAAHGRQLKKLTAATAASKQLLPLARTLEAFK